jgi:4-hydroxy-tetrahydrodipicolinate synthase
LVTPLSDRDTLDVRGLERLVEHVLDGGVQGLFILGTTGEGPSLSYHLRCELIERVCEQVSGRLPVLVGVSDTSLVESLNLAGCADEAGAAAVVVAAPYYYPLAQAELRRYIEHLAAAMPRPVLLYNAPGQTKIRFELDTLRRLLGAANIIGLKDSSADMIYFHRVLRLAAVRPDWSVLVGPEELLAEAVWLGGHGGVCGGANLCPRLYVDLYQAAAAGDTDRVADLHAQVMAIAGGIYSVGCPGGGVIQGLKSALALLGICDDLPAEPFPRLDDRGRQRIRRHLVHLGLAADVPGESISAAEENHA